MIDLSGIDEDCDLEEIVLSGLDNYETYRWSYQNQITYGKELIIQNVSSPVVLMAIDNEGCVYIDEFVPTDNFIGAPDLCVITNDDMNNNNVVLWEDPTFNAKNIVYYKILREGNATNSFDSIGVVDVADPNRFEDIDADNQQQAYKYQVIAVDKCNNESEVSNIHKTIHLTINLGTNDNINLIWDNYLGIAHDQVRILRGSTPDNLEEFVLLPTTVLSFTDQNPPSGNVFYQIEIPIEVECDFGRAPVFIRSNIAEYIFDSIEEIEWDINLFPNPVSEILQVHLEKESSLSIIDIHGSLVQQQTASRKNNIDVSDLESGVYYLRIVSHGQFSFKKFVKI